MSGYLRFSPGRRLMLRILLDADDVLTCAQISAASGVSTGDVSRAMNRLNMYGWLEVGREGRSRSFRMLPHMMPVARIILKEDDPPSSAE